MTVAELIAQLQELPQDLPVEAWSPYAEDWMDSVTVEATEASQWFRATVRIGA